MMVKIKMMTMERMMKNKNTPDISKWALKVKVTSRLWTMRKVWMTRIRWREREKMKMKTMMNKSSYRCSSICYNSNNKKVTPQLQVKMNLETMVTTKTLMRLITKSNN
jgi:hypothetical protein